MESVDGGATRDGGTVDAGESPRKRTAWTDAMVECLLELHHVTMGLAFSGSKSTAQHGVAWEKLRLKFCLAQNIRVDVTQLRNKYQSRRSQCQSLRSQYTAIKNAMTIDTGNMTEQPINYPSCWSTMMVYFGGKGGLGCVDYGQTDHAAHQRSESGTANNKRQADCEADEEQEEAETHTTRRAELAAEIQRQRESRGKPKKIDIGGGLVALGECLAKGLAASAEAKRGGSGVNEKFHALQASQDKMLTMLADNQMQIASYIQEGNSVNRAMLAFLEKKSD